MKRYTIDDIMAWNPCELYDRQRVLELMGRRKGVTLVAILCADIPDEDAVWAACRAMNDRQRRLFACDCAESVPHLANDPRCDEAVRVGRLYAEGRATDAELAAAWAAAWAADWAAAWAADWADQRYALLLLALAGEID